jgi:hypothetical protein
MYLMLAATTRVRKQQRHEELETSKSVMSAKCVSRQTVTTLCAKLPAVIKQKENAHKREMYLFGVAD